MNEVPLFHNCGVGKGWNVGLTRYENKAYICRAMPEARHGRGELDRTRRLLPNDPTEFVENKRKRVKTQERTRKLVGARQAGWSW